MVDTRSPLPIGTGIKNYVIKSALRFDDFGITYAARDISLEKPVAIREYFPSIHAIRNEEQRVVPITLNHSDDFQWGINLFLQEGRTLARFDHYHLDTMLASFEENGTAYLVLKQVVGETLSDRLEQLGRLNAVQTQRLLHEVGLGLHHLHQAGLTHGDVRADNILLRNSDDSAVLLGLGAARGLLARVKSSDTSAQLNQDTNPVSVRTDLYDLGIVGYTSVTGLNDQHHVIALPLRNTGEYDQSLLQAISQAIDPVEKSRPESIEQWFEHWGEPQRDGNAPLRATPPPLPSRAKASPSREYVHPSVRPDQLPPQHKKNKTLVVTTLIFLALAIAVFYNNRSVFEQEHAPANPEAQGDDDSGNPSDTNGLDMKSHELVQMKDQYFSAIRSRIERQWRKPKNLPRGLRCVVAVRQSRSGEVLSALVETCTNSRQREYQDGGILSRSVLRAVESASPLPPPPDPALFDSRVRFYFLVD